MTSSSKEKGDRAERECQELLRDLLERPAIRRALGAGRKDDVGDIDNVPDTVIQVTWPKSLAAGVTQKLPAVERQRRNARVPFAAVFIRRSRAQEKWVVCMTPEQFARLWKWAVYGRRVRKSRSSGHLRQRNTGLGRTQPR